MKPMSTSIYTFQDLIEGGFLYVDKTQFVYELVRYPKGLYFLSRPRRFGKSLLLSTLKSYFQGNRHLFQGLFLDDQHVEWQKHLIIHIDLGDRKAESALQFDHALCEIIHEQAAIHNVQLSGHDATAQFRELILSLAKMVRRLSF
jgi:hypothetical protein